MILSFLIALQKLVETVVGLYYIEETISYLQYLYT